MFNIGNFPSVSPEKLVLFLSLGRKFETLRNFELSESGNGNEKVWFVKVCSNLDMDLRDFLHVAYREVVVASRKFETLRIKSLECRGVLLIFIGRFY